MGRASRVLLALLLALALAACGPKEPVDGPGEGEAIPPGESGYFEGGLGDAMHTYWFDFTVDSAYVCQTFGGYTADEGERLVVVHLRVASACGFSVDMYREDFQIEWDDAGGGGYAMALSTGDLEDQDLLPDRYALGAEDSREGILVYEVPASDAQDYYITFLEVFDDGTEEGAEGSTFVVAFTVGEDRTTV